MIPPEVIDSIKQQNDIVEVIGSYLDLEKRGKNFFAICPFHNDTTPSMSVSPEKGIFNCFTCGEGGNVISFVQKYENISFIDAIKKLADRVNVDLSSYVTNKSNNNQFNGLYQTNDIACKLYQYILTSGSGKEAYNYLKNDRKLDDEIIEHFKIGLSPINSNDFLQVLKRKEISEFDLTEVGLVGDSNGRYYSKFRDRIMFAIEDEYDKVVGFSGRIYKKNIDNQPKYVNVSETKIFKKSEILYHLNKAKRHIRRYGHVILFEGFMDVIAAYRAGKKNCVATMGTALTLQHAKKLKKITDTVVLCYDGDNAGVDATIQAEKILKGVGIKTKVVQLPDGLDPDDIINKHGKDKLSEMLDKHKSIHNFVYSTIKARYNLSEYEDVKEFTQKITKYLENQNDDLLTKMIMSQVAKDTGQNEVNLIQSIGIKSETKKSIHQTVKVVKNDYSEIVFKSLILNDKYLENFTLDDLVFIENEDFKSILKIAISIYSINKELDFTELMQVVNSQLGNDVGDYFIHIIKNKDIKNIDDLELFNLQYKKIKLNYFKKQKKILTNSLKNTQTLEEQTNILKQITLIDQQIHSF